MSAEEAPQQQPEPSPKNKAKDLVTRFVEQYTEIVERAKIAAEHTSTDGWKTLFTDYRHRIQNGYRTPAKTLKQLGEKCETGGINEDERKLVKEALKQIETTENDDSIFVRDVIDKVAAPARDASMCLLEYRQAADLAETAQPLINLGLVDVMKDAIKKQPTISWDGLTGVLTIIPPEIPPKKPAKG